MIRLLMANVEHDPSREAAALWILASVLALFLAVHLLWAWRQRVLMQLDWVAMSRHFESIERVKRAMADAAAEEMKRREAFAELPTNVEGRRK